MDERALLEGGEPFLESLNQTKIEPGLAASLFANFIGLVGLTIDKCISIGKVPGLRKGGKWSLPVELCYRISDPPGKPP